MRPVKRKRRPRQSAIETRNRILDVAEQLFAAHGYDAVSLRSIIGMANVNVASINYYFGTKEKLFEEIFIRRIDAVNNERLRLLDECIRAAGNKPPRLEAVIRAYVEPFLRLHENGGGPGSAIMRFMSRAITEPNPATRARIVAKMDPIWYRFSPVMQQVLPGIHESTFYWRFYFMISALYWMGRGEYWLDTRTGSMCDLSNVDEVIAELTSFLTGGLAASAPQYTADRAGERPRAARRVVQLHPRIRLQAPSPTASDRPVRRGR